MPGSARHRPCAALVADTGYCRANIHNRKEDGWTPLHGAAMNNHLNAMLVLIAARADVNAQSNIGDTPLILAAYRGRAGAFRPLVWPPCDDCGSQRLSKHCSTQAPAPT